MNSTSTNRYKAPLDENEDQTTTPLGVKTDVADQLKRTWDSKRQVKVTVSISNPCNV